jgi:hypothetical protein
MSVIAEKICIEALSLPRDARAEIAQRLLTSLEDEDFADDVSEAWWSEIENRRRDFGEGKAKEVSAEESLRRVEAAIG